MTRKLLFASLCLLVVALMGSAGAALPGPVLGATIRHQYFPMVARDEPPIWLGPEGGTLVVLAADPRNPQNIFAGSWGGGVFKSADGGLTWEAANLGLGNLFINALAVDPLDPRVLYAGTYKGSIYKSTNAALSWAVASVGIQPEAVTYTLAVDPKTPGVVYAGTRGISNDGIAPWAGVLYKSADGGASWQAKLQNIGGVSQQDWIYSIAINPTASNIVYAASHEHGPFRSEDRGETWYPVSSGITDGSGRAIAVDPKNSATVFMGVWHNSGVFKTVNGGLSWVLEENGIADSKIYSLAIDPVLTSTLYVGTYNQGVMKSTNSGLTWLPAGSGLPSIFGLLVDPANHLRVFSGTSGAGLLLSANGGLTWAPSQSGLKASQVTATVIHPTDAKTVFTSVFGRGVMKSTNRGANWSEFNYGLTDLYVNALLIHPQNANVFYALTQSGGLFRGDRATTLGWQPIGLNLPLSTARVESGEDHPFASFEAALGVGEEALDSTTTYAPLQVMAFAPSNPKTVYLGTGGAGLYRSLDEAVTWQAAGFAGQSIEAIAVDPVNPSLVWASSSVVGGLKVTTNGGAAWSDGGLPNVITYTLKRSPGGTLYAGTSNGIYTRSGATWTHIGLAGVTVTGVGVHPSKPQVLLAGTTDGVWMTVNSGLTWLNKPTELRYHSVGDITFDWADPAWVYFNTRGHGVLRAYFRWP